MHQFSEGARSCPSVWERKRPWKCCSSCCVQACNVLQHTQAPRDHTRRCMSKNRCDPFQRVMSSSPSLYCPSRIYLSWATGTINKIHLSSFLVNIWRIPVQLSWIVVSFPAVISTKPADVLVGIVRVLVVYVKGVGSTPASVSGSQTQTGTCPTQLPLALEATLASRLCFFHAPFFLTNPFKWVIHASLWGEKSKRRRDDMRFWVIWVLPRWSSAQDYKQS